MAAAVQRKAIEDELQRFTLRVTRRTVPIISSMMLVQASERRNSAGRPSLLTVRISSNPSRMLFESRGRRAPDAGRDFGSVSPPSPHRRVPRLGATHAGPRHAELEIVRSMMFRALWSWQRWIGVWRPK